MKVPVTIDGGGIAALCCAHLLSAKGHRVSWLPSGPVRNQALLINASTQQLLADIFGHQPELFAGCPTIRQRMVRWGPGSTPNTFAHHGIVIHENDLLKRLSACPAPSVATTATSGWRICCSSQSSPGTAQHFGRRQASSAQVELRTGASSHACIVEACTGGWLFLLPTGECTASLLAIGSNAEELLEQSAVVVGHMAGFTVRPGSYPAYPRIFDPLYGDDWLGCGGGAMAFDPICGEGVGHAVREAILASAVIHSISEGQNRTAVLTHYSSRLLSGFARHLQLAASFYQPLQRHQWWQDELGHLALGFEWTRSRLSQSPPSLYRLVGLELQAHQPTT